MDRRDRKCVKIRFFTFLNFDLQVCFFKNSKKNIKIVNIFDNSCFILVQCVWCTRKNCFSIIMKTCILPSFWVFQTRKITILSTFNEFLLWDKRFFAKLNFRVSVVSSLGFWSNSVKINDITMILLILIVYLICTTLKK